MNLNKKYPLHSILNKLTIPALMILYIVGFYFIYRDAYNEITRIIGLIVLTILLILVFILFIFSFRILDYLVFTDDEIILCSYFRKNISFKYYEYVIGYGRYISIIEDKKILIFLPISLGKIVSVVDTSKFGNTIALNKNNILYCQIDDNLVKFLVEKIKNKDFYNN